METHCLHLPLDSGITQSGSVAHSAAQFEADKVFKEDYALLKWHNARIKNRE